MGCVRRNWLELSVQERCAVQRSAKRGDIHARNAPVIWSATRVTSRIFTQDSVQVGT